MIRTPRAKLEAARNRLPASAVFCGETAGWLHGLDLPPCDPINVTVPNDGHMAARSGMRVRRSALADDEVVELQGFPATSILRTLRDLVIRLDLTEGVVVTDMALHADLISPDSLTTFVSTSAHLYGVAKLRRVVAQMEPRAESPMETRLRMLLVLGRLPRPEAQVAIHDSLGRFAGRPDLFYRPQRLGLEYDGGVHKHSLADDNRRQNRLLDAGVQLLRFTAGDIYNAPERVVSLVGGALARGLHANRVGS
jgi:very-short-patch-repair endonuclease